MVRVLAFLAVMALAQPAVAIQVVEVAAPADTGCPPGAAACDTAAPPASTAPAGEDGVGPKTVIAAMVGILVLGFSFARRKSGLPEVVS